MENELSRQFPERKKDNEPGITYEFIIGNEKIPDSKLELKVKNRNAPPLDESSFFMKNPEEGKEDDEMGTKVELKEEEIVNNITIDIPYDKDIDGKDLYRE